MTNAMMTNYAHGEDTKTFILYILFGAVVAATSL
jgi:hypothetical protein